MWRFRVRAGCHQNAFNFFSFQLLTRKRAELSSIGDGEQLNDAQGVCGDRKK